ncbi:MAG: bacteriohemerythrin [Pseudodesulfovibrio sp.]
MPLMNWDEIMSVGVEELDAQHRKLIDLINDAYEALQKHDEHRMSELIDKMRDYAKVHFATEEQYLARCGFPHIEAHKVQHFQFNRTVAQFREQQFVTTNLSKIFVFLSRWLATHILESDKEYVPYLAAEEKKPA